MAISKTCGSRFFPKSDQYKIDWDLVDAYASAGLVTGFVVGGIAGLVVGGVLGYGVHTMVVGLVGGLVGCIAGALVGSLLGLIIEGCRMLHMAVSEKLTESENNNFQSV